MNAVLTTVGPAAWPRAQAKRAGAWRLERWGSARVAGLSADVLPRLRLARAAAADEALADAESRLAAAQRSLAERVHASINGCEDRALRRLLLDAKRRLFNGKPVALPEATAPSVPEWLRAELARVDQLDAARAAASSELDEAFAAEWLDASGALRRCLSDEALARGMVLSSPDLRCAAEHLLARPAGKPPSAAEQIREAALARYVFRAATRTTPFSSFAAAALLDCFEPAPAGGRAVTSSHRAQVRAGLLQAWLTRALSPEALARLPLRRNPLHYREAGSPPELVFAQAGMTAGTPDATPSLHFGFASLALGGGVERVLRAAAGRSEDAAVAALAAEGNDPAAVRRLVGQLVRLGVLERVLPRMDTGHDGLRAFARALRAIDAPVPADRVERMAELVSDYEGASAKERGAILVALEGELGPHRERSALVEDVTLHGVSAGDLPISPRALVADLAPALALARASASGSAHRLLTQAFLARHGEGGRCDDVPRFIASVLQDEPLVRALRFSREPIAWMSTPLGRAIASADGDRCALDPALFDPHALPATCEQLDVSAFVQIGVDQLGAEPELVLNGLQSGRYKYLSRFLAGHDQATNDARARLDERAGAGAAPRPVEIDVALGLNFQVHPPLTGEALELPFEAVSEARPVVRLSDLSLRYDAGAAELRLHCATLDRDIEPIHLGFLRDINLPDPLFVLRALSPRIADETVAERADVYNLFDGQDLARGAPLRPYRPRLTVGRLVLERARWAVPIADIPRKAASERYSSFFRRIAEFRRSRGLPERGFARRVGGGSTIEQLAASRMLIDWASPATLVGLERLLGPKDAASPGWLLVTELLPLPESAPLQIDGRPHVTEIVVQLRWEKDDA